MLDKKRTLVISLITLILVLICYIGLSAPKEKIVINSSVTIDEEQSIPTITVVNKTEDITQNELQELNASLQIEFALGIFIVLVISFVLCKLIARKNYIFMKQDTGSELKKEQNGKISGELL